jgi:outer membrane protein OmpA-like peptidoglycan-associated protein
MLHHNQHACFLRKNPRISVDGALGYDAIWVYLIQFLRDIGVMLARTMVFAAVGAAALLFGPLTASAQDDHRGVYVGAAAGVNVFPEDSDLGSAEADLDWSWATAGSVGYAFGNGFRAEGEFGYRPNDVDSVSGVPGASGDLSTMSFMANLLYDFRRPGWIVTPYIGVGLGMARVHADGVAPAVGVSIDDSSVGFAMQGIAGVSYDLNEHVSFTADYRHIRVPDLSFDTSAGTSVDSDYATNQFMLGVRYRFGAPAAKPAPAPVAQPAPMAAPAPKAPQPKEFLVFFDFDSAKLTPEGLNIVKSAAASAKAGGAARIVLTGHADRAGPATYNVGLSQRRADAVKTELVAQGLSAADISTQAKGETEPLVPTADGVPEPQNRRVEIVIR